MGAKEGTEKAFSVVFVNKELDRIEQDVFHMKVQMEELEKAVNAGANFIGIFSEHGGGKTSIVKNFAASLGYELCNVCLWDYENKTKTDSDGQMTSFTHSFLYQFSRVADAKYSGFTRNINRMMSKNYKQISFSTDVSGWKYGVVLFFMCCYALIIPIYNALSVKTMAPFVHISGILTGVETCLTAICEAKWGIPAVVMICVMIFFKDSNIIFSWKESDTKQELSDSDTYEVFEKIVKKAPKGLRKKKKYIVNIEDLDRVSNKDEVCEFLKALYKFNSLLTEKNRKHFVFVVSLSIKSYFEMQQEDLREKIFDYTLVLRPMNRERAADLFMNLIKEKRADIEVNLNGSSVAGWRKWLIKGDNVGIRMIKTRLNVAMAIYDDLHMEIREQERQKRNIAQEEISFEKCVVIAYLESVYPMDMYAFTKNSKAWETIMDDIKCVEKDTWSVGAEREKKLREVLNRYHENSWKFRQEIIELFSTSFHSEDYWKYFYRIPKRHYEDRAVTKE